MKMLIYPLALLLSGTFALQADVLIYQYRESSKNVGRGVEFTASSRGFIVWDLDAHHLTWIAFGSSASGKVYRVSDGNPVVVRATGFFGRTFTTFSTAGSEEGRYYQDYNRGQDVRLARRTGETVQFPRTFKGLSHSINTVGGARLSDSTHVSVVSPSRTVTANDAGLSSGEVVEELRLELEGMGYVDADASPAASGNRLSIINESPINYIPGRPLFPPLPPTPYTPPVAPANPIPLPPLPASAGRPDWVEGFTIPSKDF